MDYQGTRYDYGSVMDYDTREFNACPGCYTISINNDDEYERQGRPIIGQYVNPTVASLSPTDIIQINHLYKCPGPGRQGLLMLYIRYGQNISTKAHGVSDPYVKIDALSSNGSEHTKESSIKRGSRNPTWNEELFFPNSKWQFFRIRVWDTYDYNDFHPLAMSVTVPLLHQPKTSGMNMYCTDIACSGYIMYDYKLLKPVNGSLYVRIREGPMRPGGQGHPSWTQTHPQNVKVVAYYPSGTTTSRTLRTSNQWVKMRGCSFAGIIRIEVSSHETLDPQFVNIRRRHHTYCLPDINSDCSTISRRLEVRLTSYRDECQPNLCLNGGSCNDGCATYSCSCPDSFVGKRCQYRQG